jgi:hypothetical protein
MAKETVYTVPLVLSTTGINGSKLFGILKMHIPALYILMQNVVLLTNCPIARMFLAE